ncbi:hypothetical protein U1Q18_023106 [Sarracenia purpurea var. burkii]
MKLGCKFYLSAGFVRAKFVGTGADLLHVVLLLVLVATPRPSSLSSSSPSSLQVQPLTKSHRGHCSFSSSITADLLHAAFLFTVAAVFGAATVLGRDILLAQRTNIDLLYVPSITPLSSSLPALFILLIHHS